MGLQSRCHSLEQKVVAQGTEGKETGLTQMRCVKPNPRPNCLHQWVESIFFINIFDIIPVLTNHFFSQKNTKTSTEMFGGKRSLNGLKMLLSFICIYLNLQSECEPLKALEILTTYRAAKSSWPKMGFDAMAPSLYTQQLCSLLSCRCLLHAQTIFQNKWYMNLTKPNKHNK